MGIFQVGIFQVGVILGENFPGGSFPGWEFSLVGVLRVGIVQGNHPGGNFPGGSFPRTILKTCKFLFDYNLKKFKSRLFVLHCPFHKAKEWHFECFNSSSNVNNSILCCKRNVSMFFFL